MKDAEFWRDEIFRELSRQRAFEAETGEGDRPAIRAVERFAFVTGYMTRKLVEAVALSRT